MSPKTEYERAASQTFSMHYEKAFDLFEEQKYAEALPHFDALLNGIKSEKSDMMLYPDGVQFDPHFHFCRASCLNATGSPSEALDAIDKALRSIDMHEPDEDTPNALAHCHHVKSLILYTLGRFDEALESNANALKTHPNDAILHKNRAVFLEDTGQDVEAKKYYDFALALAEEQGNEDLVENIEFNIDSFKQDLKGTTVKPTLQNP